MCRTANDGFRSERDGRMPVDLAAVIDTRGLATALNLAGERKNMASAAK